jgi:hypothetical protein
MKKDAPAMPREERIKSQQGRADAVHVDIDDHEQGVAQAHALKSQKERYSSTTSMSEDPDFEAMNTAPEDLTRSHGSRIRTRWRRSAGE